MTKAQDKIIKRLTRLQLDSLNRILDGNDQSGIDIILKLAMGGFNRDDFDSIIEDEIEFFENLSRNPKLIHKCDPEQTAMLKHVLESIMNHEFNNLPKAKKNLHNRLQKMANIHTINTIYESV